MKCGVLFERDGVLNRAKVEHGTQMPPLTLNQFSLNESALEPLRQLRKAGFILIATTNQPGLSRGDLARRELDLMHAKLISRLGLHDVFVCPHDENDRCPCRKPKPGLFFEAAYKWHLNLDRSYVISDKWPDARAAHFAGCTSLLIESAWTRHGHHDCLLPDLAAAADKALQLHRRKNPVNHYAALRA